MSVTPQDFSTGDVQVRARARARGDQRRLRDRRGRPPRGVFTPLRLGALTAVVLLVGVGIYTIAIGAGAGAGASNRRHQAPTRSAGVTDRHAVLTKAVSPTAPTSASAAAPPLPPLVVTAPGHPTSAWAVAAEVRGQPAAWVAQRSGVTLIRFDQSHVHLNLHAGSSDGGVGGWTYGDQINAREIHKLIAAVNGGFKLTYRNVGFMSGHHVAVALQSGLASIVTYTDGTTDIGAWRAGVPSASKTVFSVLQNQRLLVDRGVAAASVSSCILACWGETIGAQTSVARSGLGITKSGQLVWAAGEQLLPAQLASALIAAGAVRAIELDINPDWVAGYLYPHHPSGPVPVPVVPGQLGIAGHLLEPYSRDFLAFVAN